MDKIGKLSTITFELFGQVITLNSTMILMTYVVIAFLAISAFLATRKLKQIPSTGQNMFEIIYEFIEEITLGTLGNKDGKSFVPFIFTIFVFVLAANWIGILPHITTFLGFIIALVHQLFTGEAVNGYLMGLQKQRLFRVKYILLLLFKIPAFEEPTRSINTDLALGILVSLLFTLIQ